MKFRELSGKLLEGHWVDRDRLMGYDVVIQGEGLVDRFEIDDEAQTITLRPAQ